MIVQTLSDDRKKPKTTWINIMTGELVTAIGFERPEGCREPNREEVDKIFRNCYVPGGDNTGWR
jgi:hypothetical protein